MRIEPVSRATLAAWADQRVMLWPDEDEAELRGEAVSMAETPRPRLHNLVALTDSGYVAGFAEASIRHDYVNGATTSPVVFLEGIFVLPEHRNAGVGAALVAAVGEWGCAQGCTEFGSDVLLDNDASHAFHMAVGFVEQDRVVCYCKPLR